jgi:hypothetical protein
MTKEYFECLEAGLSYQDFVMERLYDAGIPLISYSSKKYQTLIGENKAGIEIKFDRKFRDTGNFYIEIAEKSNPKNKEYVPSGIFRNDNTWLYIIGDYETIFIFSKEQLKKCKDNYRQVEIPTSRGFLIPTNEALQFLVIRYIQCNKDLYLEENEYIDEIYLRRQICDSITDK